MKTRLIILCMLAITIILPRLACAADTGEPTTYIIKKGDTLWGLSERFLKDPAYWPTMWANNSQITNPHLIYPGQKIRVFPDKADRTPQQQAVAAAGQAEQKPALVVPQAGDSLQDVREETRFSVIGNEGFLLETDAKPFGTIIGGHHDRLLIGLDDIVYTDIGTVNGARSGEKFTIYRVEAAVSHPVTNEIMGRKIVPLGTLQLSDIERTSSRAIITKNYKEIGPGSYLLPFRDSRPREVSLKMASRELKGYIIESASGTTTIAAGDIVYIDLGSRQGAEPGNMLYIVRDVTLDQRYAESRIQALPQELLGALVILETGARTSTALVIKSIDAVYKGDKIISHTR